MSGLRPKIMGKAIALNGDKTTTGATCIATIETVTCFNLKALRVGDPTTKCPECGQTGVVVSGLKACLNHGKLQAVHDSIVECGCPDGTNKVIAYSGSVNAQSNNRTTFSTLSTLSQSSMSQFVPATASPLTDESKSSDNILYEGVFVWTETHGSGHSFITIHKHNLVSLYSYGRYGTPGPLTLTGDGIMLYMIGEDTGKYIKDSLYILNARVFKITDADIDKIKMYFDNLWDSGAIPEFPEFPEFPEDVDKLIRRNGRSIDVYDVTGNNCTTHIVKGLKQSGTKIFEETYTPIRTQYPIEREEAFTVPVSLQNYLDRKKHNVKKSDIIEMTEEFMRKYPNNENLVPPEKGIKAQIFELITFSARVGGEVTSVDGGEMGGGILGSSYDQ